MTIKETIIEVLASKRTFYFLIFTWIFVIIFLNIILPPAPDDGWYSLISLGVLYKSQIGQYSGDEFIPSFVQLPTFMVLQGLFYHLMSLLHIAINFYTYRLFKILLIIMLLLATFYLIKIVKQRSNKNYLIYCNVFMVILSITPFAQMCWAVRPEVLGVFFILCGLIFYCKWEFCQKKSNVYFLLCAIFLGLSMTVIPPITFVAGILTFFIIFKNIREGFIFKSFLFSLVAFLPALIVVGWFLVHYPESILQFRDAIGTKPPMFADGFKTLFEHVFMLGGKSTLIKIVYLFYWLPLLFLLVAVPKLVLKNKKMYKQNTVYFLSVALYFAIVLHLSIIAGTGTYFTIISFFTVLLFTINLKLESTILKKMSINRGLLTVLLISLMLTISSYSIVHSIKFLFFEKQYYHAPKTRSAVLDQLKSGDTLFLNNGMLIPPFFAELIGMQFRGISDIKIYQVMPLYFSLNPEKGDRFLINKLTHILPEKTIWGSDKAIIIYNNGDSKLKMQLYKFKPGGLKWANFDNIEIVYEDKDFIFFRPKSITVN
jgi:hypothetical protein